MNDSVIYVRTSEDDVGNPRLSIQTQEHVCREKAKENGDKIIEVYKDVNKSGTSTKGRKEFLRMINDGLEKKFSRLYISTLSRFGRNVGEQETEIRKIQKVGISIYCVDDGLLEDKTKFMRQVKGAYNEEMIRVMQDQTEMEHKFRLEKHIPVSPPPRGYKKDKKTKKWFIDDKRAEEIKKIFEMKSNGADLKEISKELGIIVQTLKHILQNKVYLGYYTYRDFEEKWHEPIISEEVFNKCQR